MSYSNAWVEDEPTSATLANTIADYIGPNMIAIRERLDDVFGTSNTTSINTADPYAIAIIRMTAVTDSGVIGGPSSWNVWDHTNTNKNLTVFDNGDISIFSGNIIPIASTTIFKNIANTTDNLTIFDNGQVEIAGQLTIDSGGLNVVGNSGFLGNIIVVGQGSVAEFSNGSGSGSLAINWNASNNQSFTLTGNATITFTNPVVGSFYLLRIIQDSTGSRTVTWPTIKWALGIAPTLTTTPNKQDFISFYFDGTSYNGFWTGFGY